MNLTNAKRFEDCDLKYFLNYQIKQIISIFGNKKKAFTFETKKNFQKSNYNAKLILVSSILFIQNRYQL